MTRTYDALLPLLRDFGTDARGERFSPLMLFQIFLKASPISADFWNMRRDRFGSLITWDAYGDTNSPFGWEVDHILPVSKGGKDQLYNLDPLYWLNNRKKGDRVLYLL